MKARINITLYLLLLLLFAVPDKGWAASMQNPSYKLETSTFNTMSGSSSSPASKNDAQAENRKLNKDGGFNYTIEKGFPKSGNEATFSISISTSRLKFGELSPGEAILRPVEIQVVNRYKAPFFVTIFQDHPLRASTKAEIPHTTCDNGSCSETTAAIWDIPLTYGFGYSCRSKQEDVCNSDFINAQFFRQIADLEKGEFGDHLMHASSGSFEAEGLFKINISGSQQEGNYKNNLTILASTYY